MFAYKYTSVASTAATLAPSIAMLSLMGFLVNGPYALITTAVSAELGVHPSLQGNAKAKATVAAIIDGTGSIGTSAKFAPFFFFEWGIHPSLSVYFKRSGKLAFNVFVAPVSLE
jgi:hypothetical protein